MSGGVGAVSLSAPTRRLGCAALLVLVLAGCGTGGPDEHPYAAELESARQAATSDFERDVLADGQVTAAELREAQDLLTACLTDAGYVVEVLPDGGYTQESTDARPADPDAAAAFDEAMQADHDACAEGSTVLVEPLYRAITANPDNEDLNAAIASCLVRHGVREEGYGVEDLRADLDADRMSGPEVDACWDDPHG